MTSVSTHITAQPQPFALSHLPLARHKREAPAPTESAGDARTEGDRALAAEYSTALLLAANRESNINIRPIPADSSFGRWWGQLRAAFRSPDVVQWMRDKGINAESITLKPESGTITFKLKPSVDPEQKLHTVGQDDRRWGAISGPILQAARVINAGHEDTAFTPPASDLSESAPWFMVGRFYQERQDLTGPAMRRRAEELDRDQGFSPLDPSSAAGLIESRSADALQKQEATVGDVLNRYEAINELRHLAKSVDIRNPEQIPGELKRRTLSLSSPSTYQPISASQSNRVSLVQFLEDHGWHIPTHHEQLENLATALSTPAPKMPAHGNLGGALAWPVPLDQGDLQQLKADIGTGKIGDIDLGPSKNVLDYLLSGRTISAAEQSNPRRLIDTWITSPRGKALGEAIQTAFETRGVKGSASDWLLTALNSESASVSGDDVDHQAPGQIEGYRLVSAENSGKSPSTVVKELEDHLVANGKASSPEKATIQAHLLLASRAPEFLIKDIPEGVVVGTHSWVSLATAVARIEAKAPGNTASMSYADVMLEASVAPISDDERTVEYVAQTDAIKHWSVANGMDYPSTDASMTTAREAYSAQIRELREAAQTHIGQMPTTRGIALEQLKVALPHVDPELFEEKTITLQPSNRHFPGPYSILDMYIDGRGLKGAPDSADNWGEAGRGFVNLLTFGGVTLRPDGRPSAWVSSSDGFSISDVLERLNELPRPTEIFNETFSDYSSAVKKTTAAQLKHLISKQPLEDRQNLEFGKITIRKEMSFHRADQPRRVSDGVLLVETERNGQRMSYEIDRLKGTVTKLPDKTYRDYEPTVHSIKAGKRFDEVKPAGHYAAGITHENKDAQGAPNSFSSARTQYIVDALVEDINLPAVEKYAKGRTTFDSEVPLHETVEEIALNLIPLRSAIVNFTNGNVGGGVVDLAFDIFGFAVGLGAAAKGAKVAAAGASTVAKVGQVAKIIGRATVGALNPLDGVADLVRGVANGLHQGVSTAIKGVKHLRGSYRGVDLLELAKKTDVAEGTLKTANGTRESKALGKFDEATNKWYAYDPLTKQAYGRPLDNFSVDTPRLNDPNSLHSIGSNDVVKTASQQHGVAATGTFSVGQETVEGNVVLFQGNWHRYDAINKRAFGPPLTDFKPSRVAANGDVRSMDADLLGYEVKYIAPQELSTKGLQSNVYVGRSKKEYVKIDDKFYESHLKDGQRVIRHPARTGPDLPVRDLGLSGWEPLSRTDRLLGGAGGNPWNPGENTYLIPLDDIHLTGNPTRPYSLNHKGVEHDVTFNIYAGTWKSSNLKPASGAQDQDYFWRSGKGKWQRGTFSEFKHAKKVDARAFKYVDVSPPTILRVPKDAHPIPKQIHYFWAGSDIPPNLIENIANNSANAPGYKSIIHVDADSPAMFEKIKSKLHTQAPGLSVMNLHEDDFFKQLKDTEMYNYFRQGQGKNLAATSDVARYPLMNKYGGIYLDTDDAIPVNIGATALKAGSSDILLNRPVAHTITDYKPFYNTSNFATQPGNPVINDMIAEMNKRFSANKAYFESNRPTVTRGPGGEIQYTSEFRTYESKIFETVGPTMFDDVLQSKRPDMYHLGLDGLAKESKIVDGKLVSSGPIVDIEREARQYYASKGITPPDLLGNQIKKMKEHYLSLLHQLQIKIGAEHSWIGT